MPMRRSNTGGRLRHFDCKKTMTRNPFTGSGLIVLSYNNADAPKGGPRSEMLRPDVPHRTSGRFSNCCTSEQNPGQEKRLRTMGLNYPFVLGGSSTII